MKKIKTKEQKQKRNLKIIIFFYLYTSILLLFTSKFMGNNTRIM